MDEKPRFLIVAEDRDVRDLLVANLEGRFGRSYTIVASSAPAAAFAELETMRDQGREVALIAAVQGMAGETGAAFLGRTRELYPTSRRLVLASYFDLSVVPAIARASTLGEIDAYEGLPWAEADERFLATVATIVADWAGEHLRSGLVGTIVGAPGDEAAQLLKDILMRWGNPVALVGSDSPEGERLISEHGGAGRLPIAVLPDGRVLEEATISKIVEAFGFSSTPPLSSYDVVVVGLGPAGFSAALNAASEGLSVLMVEPSFSQASSSPMIRNYLGFPSGVDGAELLRRAWRQATMFGAHAVIGRAAQDVRADGEERIVAFDDGSQVHARSVVLALGAAYRRIGVPSVERLVGRGVFYVYEPGEVRALEGDPVAVVGGGNSAAQAAVHLARYASQVHLLVRGESLSEAVSDYLVQQLADLPNVQVHQNTEVVGARDRHRLQSLGLRDRRDGRESQIDATALFILIGSVPHTDWLPAGIARDQAGFVFTGDDAPDGGAPERRMALETTMRGVFAAGDVRAGSVKRVAAAVGEGAAAVQQLHRYLTAARAETHAPT